MRILIIRTFPDILDWRSYNVQEIGLAKALVCRGHKCDIVLYNGRDQDSTEIYTFEEEGKTYSFFIYKCKGYSFLKNGFMPKVKKLIYRYDVIQVHEYDQLLSWWLYTREYVPTVIYHGPYYHPYTKGYNLKCMIFDAIFLHGKKYREVRTLTKSELAVDFLKSKGFKNVVSVGVGLNTDNFRTGDTKYDNEKNDSANDERSLLYVGKIEDRRNVYFLVEVFRILRKKCEDIHLVLVGGGEPEYVDRFLKSIAIEIEEKKIIYIPKASQRELADIYKKSDIFIFTSNYEIFGMVLLEAMYFRLPVFSSENGGSSTLIQNDKNGYIFKNFQAEEWADRISRVIQDKEKMRQLGENARMTIEEGYTWDRLAEKFEREYIQAIEDFGRK